jgi:hypothetical protein
MLFKEIIVVYYENYTKHINTFCGQNGDLLNVETGGTCSYQCALSGLAPYHEDARACVWGRTKSNGKYF